MSAYLVSADTIDYIVAGAVWLGYQSRGQGDWVRWDIEADEYDQRYISPTANYDALGSHLINENIKSVIHRYPQDTLETAPGPIDKSRLIDYRYRPVHSVNAATLAKAIHCYEYQSCEHPEWQTSKSYRMCQEMLNRLVRLLPGYEDAPWGWERAA